MLLFSLEPSLDILCLLLERKKYSLLLVWGSLYKFKFISSFILSLKVLVCILEQRKWSKDKIIFRDKKFSHFLGFTLKEEFWC